MESFVQDRGRAVVFGASGGIGRALVARLAADGWEITAASRSGEPVAGARDVVRFDLTAEDTIAAAAAKLTTDPPRVCIVATGALTLPGGGAPEKSYRHLSASALAGAFAINTIGPALVAKHFLPLLPREERSVFAVLGARVGSIGDNRLGGWHSYRASKAALAMLIRNFAIEVARTHPRAIIAGLHPGTVATPLSAPFVRNVPRERLSDPVVAADRLFAVMQRLEPVDSGKVLDWQGLTVPP
jgi:NAD(P)-dependent dehydrogenase (short-subunit alcohol dehydrogenase family)